MTMCRTCRYYQVRYTPTKNGNIKEVSCWKENQVLNGDFTCTDYKADDVKE